MEYTEIEALCIIRCTGYFTYKWETLGRNNNHNSIKVLTKKLETGEFFLLEATYDTKFNTVHNIKLSPVSVVENYDIVYTPKIITNN